MMWVELVVAMLSTGKCRLIKVTCTNEGISNLKCHYRTLYPKDRKAVLQKTSPPDAPNAYCSTIHNSHDMETT